MFSHMSREEYAASLADSMLQDRVDIARDEAEWTQRQLAIAQEMGHDPTWVHLRVEMARSMERVCQAMDEQHFTPDQQRELLIAMFSATRMYEAMQIREAGWRAAQN